MLIDRIPNHYLIKISYILFVLSIVLNMDRSNITIGLIIFFLALILNIYGKRQKVFQLWKKNKALSILAIIGIVFYVFGIITYDDKTILKKDTRIRQSLIDSVFGK